ncbi:MAG: CDGSH iron-sulfur domain-containing protein [Methanobacteriota archaeon]|nr:MAG: CDGSH iron-sulfur domain-containing protein [Euryarchaeota archaeon]
MVKINALENGPLVVEAEGTYVIVKDGKEETIDQKAIALCRCGASENKPFCDGTHKKINFTAPAQQLGVK